MVKSFKTSQTGQISSDKATLDSIEQLLQLHAYETCDLIHQYYKERHREQSKMTSTPYGQLTVRCWFRDYSNLEVSVYIMNLMMLISRSFSRNSLNVLFISD